MGEITGKTLIGMGFEPGPWFGDILREANEKRLSPAQAGRLAGDRLAALEAEKAARLAKQVPMRDAPAPYAVNITAEDDDEAANVEAVKATFDELMRVPTLENGAIMPDACPAGPVGTIPVGGVAGARDAIHPGMHSADICCSMTATFVDRGDPGALLDAVHAATHFGPGGRPRDGQEPLPAALLERFKSNPFLAHPKILARARSDFATCGDGNHFNLVGRSEATGELALVSHFGSRGPGALLYKAGMEAARRHRDEISPETPDANAWLPLHHRDGWQYWDALQAVREWTKQSHAALHDKAIRAIGAGASDRIWNEHNFVFREDDDRGSIMWHAKGATPVHEPFLPDTAGVQIVPLNMAHPVLLVRGSRHDGNLGFAPHGAGRNFSRTRHKQSLEGKSDKTVFTWETRGIDARFFCGRIDVSELPSAYKNPERIEAEMKRFRLCDVVDRIVPHGSIMAGDWEADAPWRKKKQ